MANNIYLLFEQAASSFPDAPALINSSGDKRSFKDLEADCRQLAAGLIASGIKPGDRVVLMVPPDFNFYALTFALFRAGAVIVMVDPGIGVENIGKCLETAKPAAFIGSVKAHLGRLTGRWGRDTIKTLVTTGPSILRSEMSIDYVRRSAIHGKAEPHSTIGQTAAILFTSGATGVSKGAVYTHDMLYAQARLLRDRLEIKPGEVSVATFPLFGLFDVALGQTVVIPNMDTTKPAAADPEEIIRAVTANGAAQLFGSPALMETLARHAVPLGKAMLSLKRVISCGAPVSPALIAKASKMVDSRTAFITPYGSTEALPVSSITGSEILAETAELSAQGRGICVGAPWPETEVVIIKITDGPIAKWSEDLRVPQGQAGEIVVRGPMVSPSYYGLDEQTALAKIKCDDGSFFHRMGDLGCLDSRGRLWFYGRKAHRVRTETCEMYSVPCEGVFNAHPKVRRAALVGVGKPGAQIPVLCVELEPGTLPSEELKGELLELGGKYPLTSGIKRVLFHPAFPVDPRHNSKIFRDRLSDWAARELHAAPGAAS